MKNFFRVLRLVLRYKWTLVASTFTAIMVALLWAPISAVRSRRSKSSSAVNRCRIG